MKGNDEVKKRRRKSKGIRIWMRTWKKGRMRNGRCDRGWELLRIH